MAKHLAQAVVAGVQVVGKAFAKAVRQEIAASQAMAARHGGGAQGAAHAATDAKLGMSVEEARQIFNVEEDADVEAIQERYVKLFADTDKKNGGTLYLQSKVLDAKVRKTLRTLHQRFETTRNLSQPFERTGNLGISGPLYQPVRHFSATSGINLSSKTRCFQQPKRHFSSTIGKNMSSDSRPKLSWDTVMSDENRQRFIASCQRAPLTRQGLRGQKQLSVETPSSAVLVPLCHVEGELCLLYTRRAMTLSQHKGEVSFPGGFAEDADEGDLVRTALRETQEELYIRREIVDVWGEAGRMPQKDGRIVVAVLGYIGELDIARQRMNLKEVASVFAVSLKLLCKPESFAQTQFRGYKGRGYAMPLYNCTDPVVWGLTATFTHLTLTNLLPGLYTHKVHFARKLSS